MGNEIVAVFVRHHRLVCCAHHRDKHIKKDDLSEEGR